MSALLEIDDLTVDFAAGPRVAHAVRGVSLTVEAGRTTVVLGESGSGKSVTARAIMGLVGGPATIRGAVRLDGADLLGLDERAMRDLRGRDMGLVPQDPNGSLDPLRRVGAQIGEVLRAHRVVASRAARRARVQELLAHAGITDPARVARSYPHELSGGMRQRVAIAAAVACGPRLLIADEPTTALDMTVQARILELFDRLQRDLDMAILLVTHDVGVARQMGSSVVVMYAGRVVEQGPARRVIERPAHPYTAALLGAQPRPGIPRGELLALPGLPPSATTPIDDRCALVPRCAHSIAGCSAALPRLEPVADSGSSACPVPWASAPATERSSG
ncbi:ABC transporter ATP-binding protein [Nonomuraea sp. NEAU-A123]|uniref:ABC transporter ATP-binding protein n=1 Tax=Nonomuraea sp. NEAU-A123 TaxID=2839649 RepID=UPI001BE46E7F|nr:ABC transporter ATP-binding protein [Nonomuraea sp. NEAU-A123]MBT2234211.1 ABC transporter ATP-binding protein [Nonomuraea sp. NEAU-A123]